MNKSKNAEAYQCMEQGPIRPPAEARSLLLRVTRNCPWNRCTFCPLYKNKRFTLRPMAHIRRDIDLVHEFVTAMGKIATTVLIFVGLGIFAVAIQQFAQYHMRKREEHTEWLIGRLGNHRASDPPAANKDDPPRS